MEDARISLKTPVARVRVVVAAPELEQLSALGRLVLRGAAEGAPRSDVALAVGLPTAVVDREVDALVKGEVVTEAGEGLRLAEPTGIALWQRAQAAQAAGSQTLLLDMFAQRLLPAGVFPAACAGDRSERCRLPSRIPRAALRNPNQRDVVERVLSEHAGLQPEDFEQGHVVVTLREVDRFFTGVHVPWRQLVIGPAATRLWDSQPSRGRERRINRGDAVWTERWVLPFEPASTGGGTLAPPRHTAKDEGGALPWLLDQTTGLIYDAEDLAGSLANRLIDVRGPVVRLPERFAERELRGAVADGRLRLGGAAARREPPGAGADEGAHLRVGARRRLLCRLSVEDLRGEHGYLSDGGRVRRCGGGGGGGGGIDA